MNLHFSEELEQAIARSREEALRFRHNYIDSGHLLLGMIVGGEGKGRELLEKLSVPVDALRHTTEKLMQIPSAVPLSADDDVPVTSEAEKILKLSYTKARICKSSIINSEHLLLSMLDYRQSVACQLLRHFGLRYDNTASLLGGPPAGMKSNLQRFWAKVNNR
jgi:ATP-dependent Clp protease ATP-binding subunit ClpC